MRFILTCSAFVLALAGLAGAQIVEIPAMTVVNIQIDMDNVGPAGPTNLGALNAGGSPVPASIFNLTLSPSTAAAGVYNTNPQLGRALALDTAGTGLVLVDSPSGAFTAFDASILLGCPSTEFGCSIGDWIGPINFTLFLGGSQVGTISVDYAPAPSGAARFFQSQVGPFDQVDFVASTTGGNWVIPDIYVQVCGPPPPTEFQVNTPVADLRVNGQFVNPFSATVVNLDVQIDMAGNLLSAATGSLTMSSEGPGTAYDILISSVSLVPLTAGGLSLGASGEILNLNILGVGFTSFNAGLPGFVSLESFPGGNFPGATSASFTVPFSFGAAIGGSTISVQGVVLDPASPSGFKLTGATQVDVSLTII
jgi:hypothetical protein